MYEQGKTHRVEKDERNHQGECTRPGPCPCPTADLEAVPLRQQHVHIRQVQAQHAVEAVRRLRCTGCFGPLLEVPDCELRVAVAVNELMTQWGGGTGTVREPLDGSKPGEDRKVNCPRAGRFAWTQRRVQFGG